MYGKISNMKVLAISGSLRKDSFNRKALQIAKGFASNAGAKVKEVDLKELSLPVFDADMKAPRSVSLIQKEFADANVLIIATPEYSRSIPGGLKNALDWVSLTSSTPLEGKVAIILGASSGHFGTVRAQIHLKQILMALGAFIVPQPEIFISYAQEAFNEDGTLKDSTLSEKLKILIEKSINLAKRT